ncbi:ATP-dependent Clp protease proteolytic subunit [Weissella tructae]|jgi:ATP-dependent Clp protease protease subunit|uniref:ATP-dependent Clp protease proteolytic subunit n=2 Tax=Weissella TaxID=46255 RepID=A0A075U1C8_9LACO|nr:MULTISPECIES: ATP-dependent Clp protease proteolytic subunit [Weissella]AIG65968.1 ATP-dependent Clp protease proteolytic subunit [Weissella tructae]AIM63346.1 ATP-dependent Clp protease proteolytic subunit [Weissella ceti]AIM64681.1 ATP-dependent Clp protease proteolytic subunit [Weissella ceti]ELA07338.1 ATP-dependent Clp protease proteolytic subunit [Weissella ceti NC36]QVV91122.1 ATP-dependent Clp protease proteolytic subunit [Weissella tructae]
MLPIPYVIEQSSRGERSYDIFSRLLIDRIVMVTGPIDSQMSTSIIAQLLFLDAQDPDKDIYMYINSPGGEVIAGMAIYDTMQFIKSDVQTIVIGMAASMGSVLASSGAKGKRFILPNSQFMIHQPSGGAQGQQSDIAIAAEEIMKTRKKLNQILADNTGQPYERLEQDTERDYWLDAEESVAYGLADKIMVNAADRETENK